MSSAAVLLKQDLLHLVTSHQEEFMIRMKAKFICIIQSLTASRCDKRLRKVSNSRGPLPKFWTTVNLVDKETARCSFLRQVRKRRRLVESYRYNN